MHQNKPQVSSKHSFDVSIVQKSDKTTVQNQKCLIFALGFRYCKRMPPSPLFPKVLFGSPIELSLPVQPVRLHRRLPVPRAQTEAPETSRGLGHFQQRWSWFPVSCMTDETKPWSKLDVPGTEYLSIAIILGIRLSVAVHGIRDC